MNIKQNTTNFNRNILIWLITLTLMVFAIIIVGGLTRLTNSGLSMVNWRPILGIMPPLNVNDWNEVFNLYKTSPEYMYVNQTISLNEFKYIFWWEWGHRVLARLIGLVFFFPFIYFIFKKYLNFKLIIRLTIILIFGFFQALVGWWMVKSGLSEDPYVSAYRLTFHLMNALIIFVLLLWTTMDYYYNDFIKIFKRTDFNGYNILISLILILLTIITGGFMAGTDSGQSFNTYPLMAGEIFPDDYFLEDLGILNLFENTVAINFNHRWLATFTFLYVFVFFTYIILTKNPALSRLLALIVLFLLSIQFFLGIITLLSNVNINYASLHQTNSVLLLSSIIVVFHQYKVKKTKLIQKMS